MVYQCDGYHALGVVSRNHLFKSMHCLRVTVQNFLAKLQIHLPKVCSLT